MTVKAYNRDGQPVELEEADAARAWEAGEVAFSGERVAVRAPDGSLGFIDNSPEEIRSALSSGFSLGNQAEAEREEFVASSSSPLTTFAEQAARLPVLGSVPEFVAGELAESNRFGTEFQRSAQAYGQRLQARTEADPTAAAIGEVAGEVAPIVLTGGAAGAGAGLEAGILSRLGGGALARAAARGAGLGVEGALEGAYLGGEEVLSEAALGDTELTGERLAAGVGMGAMLGFGGGALIGGGGRLLGEASQAARQQAARHIEALAPRFREAMSPGALERFAQEQAFRSLRPFKKDVTSALRTSGGVEGVGEVLLRREIVTARGTLDDAARRLDEITPQVGEEIGQLVRRADEAGAAIDAAAVRARVDALRSELGTALTGSKRRIAQQLDDELSPFLSQVDDAIATGQHIGAEDAWRMRREIDEAVNWHRAAQDAPPKLNDSLMDVRRLLEEEVERSMGAAGDDVVSAYRTLKKDYSALSVARRAAERRLEADVANRTFSLTDYITMGGGAAAGATFLSGVPGAALAFGFLSGAVNNFFRTRGLQMLSVGAHRLSRLRVARDMAQTVESRVSDGVGAYMARVAGETGRRTEHAARSAAVAFAVDDYTQRVETLSRSLASPQAMTEELGRRTAALAESAPETAAAMQVTAARGARFLHDKIPPASRPRPALFQRERRRPSDAEMATFMRYARAVEDPGTVIDDLENGRLSRQGVEALREVYPRIYAEVVKQVVDAIAEAPVLPPYEERLQLGILLGTATDPSLHPNFVASMQTAYAVPAQPSPARASQPLDIASGDLSESQRLDARRRSA